MKKISKVFNILLALALSAVTIVGAYEISTNGRIGGARLGIKTDGVFLVSSNGVDYNLEAYGEVAGVLSPGEKLTQEIQLKSSGEYSEVMVTDIQVTNQVEFTKCLRVEFTYGEYTLAYSPCREQPYTWSIPEAVDSTPRTMTIRYWWEEADEACTIENALDQQDIEISISLGVIK